MLIIITAKFDLELKQYNIINTFINIKLDKKIYIKIPLGYQKP